MHCTRAGVVIVVFPLIGEAAAKMRSAIVGPCMDDLLAMTCNFSLFDISMLLLAMAAGSWPIGSSDARVACIVCLVFSGSNTFSESMLMLSTSLS